MQNSKEEFERRTKNRVEYRGYSTLVAPSISSEAYVINLSETGALIALLDENPLTVDESVTLNVDLSTGGSAILQGRVAHIKEHFIGLECTPRSEEDAVRLRQFLEASGLPLTD